MAGLAATDPAARQAPQPTATLCAIFKDERPYVLEWVAYHRLLGFDRIVVYSNDCRDGTDLLLDGLAQAGVLEHRRWNSVPGQAPQILAYGDAIGRCRTRWIGFLDADEFLLLSADATVGAFLSRFAGDIAAIAINWRVFGSAGHLTHGSGPVIERFTRASLRARGVNMHCKTIAVAADIERPHIHSVFLARGRYVNTSGEDINIARFGFTPSIRHEFAQVNHYVLKSREEFEDKRRRGNANRPTDSAEKYSTRDGPYFEKHDLNDEPDTAIQACLPAVRAEMTRLQALLPA